MSSTISTTTRLETFFGDGRYNFQLTAPLIIELERSTGSGIGGLAKRLFAHDYRYHELSELIRLALIGGGQTPQRAKELTETYVHGLPISTAIPVAVNILEATFFGVDKPQDKADAQ